MIVEKQVLGPRVAIVATDLSTGGGVNRVIRDLAVMFSERLDCRVTVLNGRSNRPPTYPFPSSVERIDQPSRSLWRYLKALWSLRRSRPDVVIGSWTQDNILLVLSFLFARTKVVLVEHSSSHFHRAPIRLLRRLAYPLADEVVVLNRADLAYYREFLATVRMIANPVEPMSRAATTSRAKQIIAVGHLSKTKNFGDAIEAFARSQLGADGWSLTLVGSGPEEQALLDQIDRLGVQDTTFLRPDAELASLYQRSSLKLLTSRSESFSLVLAEAMAAGVVPLAYATNGPSFILEGFPELLVEIGDVATLAERLQALARSEDLDPLRQRLAASIRTRFATGVVAERWREVLGR